MQFFAVMPDKQQCGKILEARTVFKRFDAHGTFSKTLLGSCTRS